MNRHERKERTPQAPCQSDAGAGRKTSPEDALTGYLQGAESVSLYAALKAAEAYLCACGVADAAVDAWLLLEHITGIGRAVFLAEQRRPMAENDRERYLALLKRRGSHIPLQHITGEQEFMGLSFRVNEHVLIPRQDTEILAEEALNCLKPGMEVLDLCTGSGCIAVSLAKLGPGRKAGDRSAFQAGPEETCGAYLRVTASDISREALAVAQENAERLGAEVTFIESDLFVQVAGVYDLIVSNPPYIRTAVIEELSEEVRLHEPYQALDGREDGLYFYRRIIKESGAHLREGGHLLFEIGYDQGSAVAELLEEAGYKEIKIVKDLAGLDRVVSGRR